MDYVIYVQENGTMSDCYICSDCGERVDEELSLPDGSCNWCAVYDAKTGEQ